MEAASVVLYGRGVFLYGVIVETHHRRVSTVGEGGTACHLGRRTEAVGRKEGHLYKRILWGETSYAVPQASRLLTSLHVGGWMLMELALDMGEVEA